MIVIGVACFAGTDLRAQYSADFQTNIISGVMSNWTGGYGVGGPFLGDVLLVQNGGVLSNQGGSIGSGTGTNSVVVSGPGSVWNNTSLTVGIESSGNSLVISNGGKVIDTSTCFVPAGDIGVSNRVLVTDPGSVWTNGDDALFVGAGYNSLVISNGGQVYNNNWEMGLGVPSVSNLVVVTGPGSIWHTLNALFVGYRSAGNEVIIANGGTATATNGVYIGLDITADSNGIVVTGTGSVLTCPDLHLGGGAPGNYLKILGGGHVVDDVASLGNSNNTALVSDPGSVWSNGTLSVAGDPNNSLVISNGSLVVDDWVDIGPGFANSNTVRIVDGGMWRNNTLNVGDAGSGNSLVIDGGQVSALNLVVGLEATTCDNIVELDGGSLSVTNASGNAVLQVLNGKLIVNGGVLRVDQLVLVNNGCGTEFAHNGGTLIIGNMLAIDPGAFYITEVSRRANDVRISWVMRGGLNINVLQASAGGVDGSYSTNGFADIFAVTNSWDNTVTNYLDVGAATNSPARYYRVHLVPWDGGVE